MNSLDEQQEMVGELRRRFPLFDRTIGQFGKDTGKERIPWFFGFFLAASMKPEPGPCCFVLNKTAATTAITAVLLALVRLQADLPEMVRDYARTALSPGLRVKVKPSDLVYEYEGLWEEYPHLFRLRVLGKNTWRSFPIVDMLRLEPTDRVRPKGTGNSDLGEPERSSIDHLLDLTICGNNSIIRNTVLVYMAQAQFGKAMDAIMLAPKHANRFDRLSSFLPWGSIGREGELRPNDTYQLTGEPIVAVTRVPEDLALACSSAAVATKVVLVDGARGLANDLQAFDDISDRQMVVVLASSDETEALKRLKDRGCAIWHMPPSGILIGEASSGNRACASFVGATIRAAVAGQHARVTTIACHDSAIQAVAESLEQAAAIIEKSEEADEVEAILGRLYGILLACSECCLGVSEETDINLRIARNQMTQHAQWLDTEVSREFQKAADGLENIISRRSAGQEKADALLNIILAEHNESWAVAARSRQTAGSLRAGLGDLGVDIPVLPVEEIRSDRHYAGIIVPAWPNEHKFTRLRTHAITPDIRILAYPFESKWVLRHQARERGHVRSSRMTADALSSILGIEPRFLSFLDHPEPDPPVNDKLPDPPIFSIVERIARRRIKKRPAVAVEGESSREALLVQFVGNCYALLTEWAELPKLNELIDRAGADEAKLQTVTVSQLSPGDFVLFRDGGNKEFIRLIAEDIVGTEEYPRVRALAGRWKPTLRSLGASPSEVQRRLADHGLNRTTMTVAGWLGNPARIGPGDPSDIEFIARLADDMELLSIIDDVQEAISHIRGAHISAGGQLTQLLLGEVGGQLNQMDDQPLRLDLDYGKAWVVKVDIVETTQHEYPANSVNRLFWTDDIAL